MRCSQLKNVNLIQLCWNIKLNDGTLVTKKTFHIKFFLHKNSNQNVKTNKECLSTQMGGAGGLRRFGLL